MAKKRPAPDDHGDEKRSRPSDGAPASNGAPKSNGPPKNIQEQIAAAKARAAAARERISAAAAGISKTGPPSDSVAAAGPPQMARQSDPTDPPPRVPVSEARAKIEAMKARVAAATARSNGSAPPQRPAAAPPAPPSQRQAQMPAEPAQPATKSRGGLGVGLHPALLGSSDSSQGKASFGQKFGTTMGNRRPQPAGRDGGADPKKKLDLSAPTLDELKQNPYFDSSLAGGSAAPRVRKSRELVMNQKGKYMAQANALRRQAQLEEMKRRIAESTRKAGLDEDKSEQAFLVKDIPDVEWWDENLIDGTTYPDLSRPDGAAHLKITTPDSVVTAYIQHPVLYDAPSESLPFTPKPMHLTKTEQRKIRRQNRMADLKEKQAKVRLGLEEPEAPKVKKSNLMRVLGEQAVKDPTAVEARVNREIAERRARHDDANASRQLSKEDRAAKVADNMKADAARGLHVAAFRVGSLASGRNRAKLAMNAKQHHDLTGVQLTSPRCCVVVVEAGARTVAFFKKLMLRRVDWTEIAPVSTSAAAQDDAGKQPKRPLPEWLKPEDESGALRDLSANKCVLLWEGEEKDRRFRKWFERDCASDGEARAALEGWKMENMWMMAKNWVDDGLA